MPAAAAVFFCAALLSTVLDDATAAGAGPLVMHHIGSCSECGRSAQGSRASWCPCPNASNPSCKGAANGNCTKFVFDAGHLKGQPLSPTTCAQLPPHAETYCLKGTQDLWAAVPCPEPCHLPTPPPAPTFPPTTFHIPFNGRGSGHGGCCADINAISEHNGVKHLFKQSGGVHDPTSSGLGFAHYISDDFVRWKYLSTIVTPGGADGSLTFGLPGGPVILWDCTSAGACTGGPEADTSSSHQRAAETDDDRSQTGSRTNSQGCQSGDAAIIGVARPTNASDPKLEHWTKDAKNPIVVGPAGTDCFAGPSNLWASADKSATYLEMIFNTTTGLFKSTDQDLHSWTLVNGDFYPTRGGGGGLFFPLPDARPTQPAATAGGVDYSSASAESDPPPFTHMLQSDFPSHADGTAFYALGVYDESEGSFEHATGLQEPRALDLSQTYVYNQLGYRSDGRMVNVGWIRDLGTSVVREVRYDPTVGGGQLLAWPVEELHELRQEVLGSSKGKLLQANHTESLVTSGATAADMEFLFATFADAPLEVTVTALGLTVDLSVHGSNATIAVNRAEAATSTPGLQSAAARLSNAAAVPRNGVDCGGNFFVPKNLTQVSLRILIDGVSIEAFAVDGRGVCSFAHPTPPPKSSSAVLITSGRAETTLLNATVWRMGAISYS